MARAAADEVNRAAANGNEVEAAAVLTVHLKVVIGTHHYIEAPLPLNHHTEPPPRSPTQVEKAGISVWRQSSNTQ